MDCPKKVVWLGRWSFGFWTRPRFWSWVPQRKETHSGKVAYFMWLCFEVTLERKTTMSMSKNDWKHRAAMRATEVDALRTTLTAKDEQIARLRAALSLIAGHAEGTAYKYCKCASCIAKRALCGEGE